MYASAMRKLWGIPVILLALSGCGGAAASSPSPTVDMDKVFLSSWHDRWPTAKDDAAVGLGHDICNAYKAGTSFAGEVQWLIANGSGNVTGGDAGYMIGAATSSYCPEYKDLH